MKQLVPHMKCKSKTVEAHKAETKILLSIYRPWSFKDITISLQVRRPRIFVPFSPVHAGIFLVSYTCMYKFYENIDCKIEIWSDLSIGTSLARWKEKKQKDAHPVRIQTFQNACAFSKDLLYQ